MAPTDERVQLIESCSLAGLAAAADETVSEEQSGFVAGVGAPADLESGRGPRTAQRVPDDFLASLSRGTADLRADMRATAKRLAETIPEPMQARLHHASENIERFRSRTRNIRRAWREEIQEVFDAEDPLSPGKLRTPQLVSLALALAEPGSGRRMELRYTAKFRLPGRSGETHEWSPPPFTADEALRALGNARHHLIRPRIPRVVKGEAPGPRRGICIRCLRESLVLVAWLLFLGVCVGTTWGVTVLLEPLALRVLRFVPSPVDDWLKEEWALLTVARTLAVVVSALFVMLGVRLVYALPSFVLPTKLFLQIEHRDETERVRIILTEMLQSESLASSPEVCEFLGVSSKTIRGGLITKEGRVECRCHATADTVLARTRLHRLSCICCHCYWRCVGGLWPDGDPLLVRWAVLELDGIAIYRNILEDDPVDILLFDTSFSCWISCEERDSHHIFVATSGRTLELSVGAESSSAWMSAVTHAANSSLRTKEQRFGSFSPPMKSTGPQGLVAVRWLICARAAFRRIAETIATARKEVFIAGWMLTPHLRLVRDRGPAEEEAMVLSDLLARKAAEGVKVFVLLYEEAESFLPNDSAWARLELRCRSRDIHVLRHRSRFLSNALWSHHEKVVVVDQAVGFCGGIDLCLGRYDSPEHPLFDTGGSWNGMDYYNPRIRDIHPGGEVRRESEDLVDRLTVPRMPWEDVHCQVVGKPAAELAWHFAQRWNHAREAEHIDHFPICVPRHFGPADLRYRRGGTEGEEELSAAAEFPAGRLERSISEVSDLGWEDDVLQALHHQQSGAADVSSCWPPEESPLVWDARCQILRSSSRWSAGIGVESSIHTAYCSFIQCAKRFVVIENQFWCSGMDGDEHLGNRVSEALFARISRAVERDEPFHAYVFMPLFPAFEGPVDIKNRDSFTLLSVMNWQLRTIRLLQRRIRDDLAHDPDDFLSTLALRRWSERPDGALVTEQIYIHSKVMIVDDEIAVIGSANINDRSMLGIRDSEVCAAIESRSFSKSFREALFAQHFGRPKESAELDLESATAHIEIRKIASANTAIFEEVFRCLPSDSVGTWPELESYRSASGGPKGGLDAAAIPPGAQTSDCVSRLSHIQGHVVRYPVRFLAQEDRLDSGGRFLDRLAPSDAFT